MHVLVISVIYKDVTMQKGRREPTLGDRYDTQSFSQHQ